ncbi:MAG: polyphosphate polymerase domain-containing protein [Oscillospiraceae bacterium]|nr:polyphosphate polymerase domain-containing protein [Oscillospiraceae bacterium]
MAISTFQRREVKFLMSLEQYEALLPIVHAHMEPDRFCVDGKEYGIYNLYYDTPTDLLIRRSIVKPFFKEKLRLRSYYSPADPEQSVFLEIKRKINGIVTKRRVSMTVTDAETYILTRVKPYYERFIDQQVIREIDVFLNSYDSVAPKHYIGYQRSAFFGKDDPEFRLTFDRDITERRYDLSITKGNYGGKIIRDDQRLMEIKVPGSIPLWMSQALSEIGIRRTSFSKYGRAYKKFIQNAGAEVPQEERKAFYA